MTNFKTLRQLRPAYDEMSNPANLIYRGEAMSFRPNVSGPYYSTDVGGFRHTTFRGKALAVRDVVSQPKYGLVLGSSHIFGLGMPGNEFTIPSLLATRFGFPFANLSLPEANSRNLFALLAAQLARAPRPPEIVILFNGGDFTSYAVTSIADPIFGAPNLKQLPTIKEEVGEFPPSGASIEAVDAFTEMWTGAIFELCQSKGVPFAMGRDSTFFEKEGATAFERHCELGTPSKDFEIRWFATHRKFNPKSFQRREEFAKSLGVILAGPKPPTKLTFLDEFHYDRNGMRMVFDELANAIAPLLAA